MKRFSLLLICTALVATGPLWAAGVDDTGNDEVNPLLKYQPTPGSEWAEQGLVIPPYPREEGLVEVPVGRFDYPYTLLVDTGSISVGEDKVVRYTVVLRSSAGVDNISFEGLLCNRNRYKRYAYGSGGVFYPMANADWQRIRHNRQDVYRRVLAEDYFCPLPGVDPVPQLVNRLKHRGATGYRLTDD